MKNRIEAYSKLHIEAKHDFLYRFKAEIKPKAIDIFMNQKANDEMVRTNFYPKIRKNLLVKNFKKNNLIIKEKINIILTFDESIMNIFEGNCNLNNMDFVEFEFNSKKLILLLRPFLLEFISKFNKSFNINIVYIKKDYINDDLFINLKQKYNCFSKTNFYKIDYKDKCNILNILKLKKNIIFITNNHSFWSNEKNKLIENIYLRNFDYFKEKNTEDYYKFNNHDFKNKNNINFYECKDSKFYQFEDIIIFLSNIYEKFSIIPYLYFNNFNQFKLKNIFQSNTKKIFKNMKFYLITNNMNLKTIFNEIIIYLGGINNKEENKDNIYLLCDDFTGLINYNNIKRKFYSFSFVFESFYRLSLQELENYRIN